MGSPIPPRPSSDVEIEARSFIHQLTAAPTFKAATILAVLGIVVTIFAGGSFLGVVLIIGAIVVAGFGLAPSIQAAFGWQAATLTLSANPVELGSSPVATYRRPARKSRDVPDCIVSCRVVCEERVEYRRGTDTEVETARVYQQTFTGPGVGTPQGLEATVHLEVPAWTGAPSFDLGRNSVRWYVLTAVEGPGLPTDEQHFPVLVTPALHPDVRNQVGDR